MAVTLNASTSSGFIATSDTSGVLELQNNGTTRMTVNSSGVSFAAQPLIGGVAPPAFAASTTSALTVSNNVYTKLQPATEDFDTASRFNNTGSTVGGIPAYAFLPNVAGYYMFYGYCYGTGTTNVQLVEVAIYKNGAGAVGGSLTYNTANYQSANSNCQILLYMNGTTDYVELYGRVVGAGTLTIGSTGASSTTRFGGFLARAA